MYARLDAVAAELRAAVGAAFEAAGVPHVVQGAGSLFSVFLGEAPARDGVADYAAAQGQDVEGHRRFFHAMLEAGVMLPPSAFEAWFVTAAHDDAAMGRVLEALPGAARAAAQEHGAYQGR